MLRNTQAPDHDGYVAVDVPYDCGQCIAAKAARFDFPVLDTANATAWILYHDIEDQVRLGMDIVGLDYGVFPVAFWAHGVAEEDQRATFRKLVVLNRAAQQHRAYQRELDKSRKAAEQHQRVADGR